MWLVMKKLFWPVCIRWNTSQKRWLSALSIVTLPPTKIRIPPDGLGWQSVVDKSCWTVLKGNSANFFKMSTLPIICSFSQVNKLLFCFVDRDCVRKRFKMQTYVERCEILSILIKNTVIMVYEGFSYLLKIRSCHDDVFSFFFRKVCGSEFQEWVN